MAEAKRNPTDAEIIAAKKAAKEKALKRQRREGKRRLRDEDISVIKVEVHIPTSVGSFSRRIPPQFDANADFIDMDNTDVPDSDWPGLPDLTSEPPPEP